MRKMLLLAALLTLGSAVLGATVLHEPIARAAASANTPFQNVIIRNAPSEPIPVTGQVQGTVSVKQTLQAVQVSRFGTFATGERFSSEEVLYTVPAGKTLVIESFTSGSNMSPTDRFMSARLEAELAGDTSSGYLHPTDEGVFSSTNARVFKGTEELTMYAGPGTTVSASAVRDGTVLSGTAVGFGIAGHLVDTP